MEEIVIRGHSFTVKRWNYGEKQAAVKAATTFKRDEKSGETVADVDAWRLNDGMILACIVKWDLKNAKGEPLAKTLEGLHSCEDPELIEDLLEKIQDVNGLKPLARKKS